MKTWTVHHEPETPGLYKWVVRDGGNCAIYRDTKEAAEKQAQWCNEDEAKREAWKAAQA